MSDPAARIREAGDAAMLLELAPVIDAGINARAIQIAATLRAAAIAGVRDVVPTYRSVAVYFDPLVADTSLIIHALRDALRAPANADAARLVEIPVEYGGAGGPDLETIAAAAGLSNQEVVDRHASPTYRVFMLGFLPGFAYLGTVDERIAAPRHASPRVRVPAGSVGIAGRQTGVYPRESPGGWKLIGRTTTAMFDPGRVPASLLAAGDRVRFVPTSPLAAAVAPQATRVVETLGPGGHAAAAVVVMQPGLFTTVQDLGRWGQQASGVPVGGPMDVVSHRLANLLVGNAAGAATLEVTLVGPELRIDADTVIAMTGADLGPTLDGRPLPLDTPVPCRARSVLRCGERRRGARAYLAFSGGIDLAPVLGSRATHVVSGLGPFDGRALKAGDRLPLGEGVSLPMQRPAALPHVITGGARLRVLPGPQDDFFPPSALDVLQHTRFTLTSRSDRMGYRLLGRARIDRVHDREMISDATLMGGIQVPASGEPILLMADRQTTGGYPQIAAVIAADLPLAGQLAPGDWVEFQLCTRAEARAALLAQEAQLRALA